ncbi:DUF7344 domain-containing protein [Halostagnicola kamekurae]|uniref:DUF7344 domain-containing protein n=1 Tax=Halostagnicola kamekurae TaxID=619731 RepID=A0A1I6QXN5_9EURY|nr:hypothetical protein [Halostagnicola kamekurae]SFS57018.1 hypothetical protein SAMN04488556_1665 [Halostagnicola kamekurae]
MTNYANRPTSKPATGDEKRLDVTLKALADPVRRRLVAFVLETPRSTRTAAELANRLEGEDGFSVASLESLLLDLHHRHLPMLTDAGVLSYDPETKRVDAAIGAATLEEKTPDAFESGLLEHLEDQDRNADETDALFEALADPRRRRIVETLADRSHAVTVESIAMDLTREPDHGNTQSVAPGDWRHVMGAIVHTDLPLLEDAGLIEYDRDESSVRYRDGSGRDDETAAIVELSASC